MILWAKVHLCGPKYNHKIFPPNYCHLFTIACSHNGDPFRQLGSIMSKYKGFLWGWKTARNAYFAVFLPDSFSLRACTFYAVSKPQWFSFRPMNFILLASTVLFWWLLKGDVFWIVEQFAFWSSLHLSQFATLAGRAAQIRVIDTTWYGWCWRWISSWSDNKQLFPDFLNMVKMIVRLT